MTSSAFRHFVTTTHPSHHVITKLVIPYHQPTCHQLSSLGKQTKKKEETNKESCLLFSLFKAKQKTNLFFSDENKKEKTRKISKERSCCFFQAKGKHFFSFRTIQKKDKQTSCTALKK